MMRALAALLLTAGLALAQMDSNTITITASRSISSVPDQVSFSLQVSTGTDANLSDALAMVHSLGLTVSDLSSVGTYTTYDSKGRANGTGLRWSFTVNAPVSSLKGTSARLQAFAQNTKGVTIGISGWQSNGQCAVNDLIADARVQAQLLASAAAVSVAPILGITATPTPDTSRVVFPANIIPASRIDPTAVIVATSYTGAPYIAQSCSVTVKFTLLRYQ
jgi:uncharacterized protein YggE